GRRTARRLHRRRGLARAHADDARRPAQRARGAGARPLGQPVRRDAAANARGASDRHAVSHRRAVARERGARASGAARRRDAEDGDRDSRRVLRLRAAGQPRRRRDHAPRERAARRGERRRAVIADRKLAAATAESQPLLDRRWIDPPFARPFVVLIPLVAIAALASIWVGRTSSGPAFGLGDAALARTILLEIRVPRTLLALLVGGTLGLCGAALQGLLRNPLAEPGLLGASSGAALGAVIVFYFGIAAADSLLLPLGGVAGSIGALALLYALAGRRAALVTI